MCNGGFDHTCRGLHTCSGVLVLMVGGRQVHHGSARGWGAIVCPEGRPMENGVVFVVLVACLFDSAGSSVGGALLQRQCHGEAGR